MANLLKTSDAAALALHAVVFLAARPEGLHSTGQIASALDASEAHLSKVLQRLSRSGLVRAARGPKGGFALARPADRITLLEVYESIEGPLRPGNCLLGAPVCKGNGCILGPLLKDINRQVSNYLSTTRLSEITGIYGGDEND